MPILPGQPSTTKLVDGTGDSVADDATDSIKVKITGGSSAGTEYTVDAVAPAAPSGGTVLAERDDQLSALTEVEGDWTNARATAKGALWVAIADSLGDPITSFGGGTQYTEGDVDATITGNALMMEGAANTLVAAPGTVADGLLVNLGANNDVTVTGTVTASLAAAQTLATVTTVGTVTTITNPVAVTGPLTDTQLRNSAVPVSVSGVSTAANQTTELASLSSLDTKTPALGQALAAASTPVVLTAAQLTTLTPVAAITGFALEATQILGATAALQTSGNASLTTIAALSKAEDSVSTDADTGVPVLTVREDNPASVTGLLGDYQWFTSDSQGRLWVNSDVLGELAKRANDLNLAQARIMTDQLRFSSMMAGAFMPVPEVY